jgi:hypothetical protein
MNGFHKLYHTCKVFEHMIGLLCYVGFNRIGRKGQDITKTLNQLTSS